MFVRNTMTRFDTGDMDDPYGWSNELDVDSARAGLKYRDRKRNLQLEIEAEFAGRDVELRDAYLRWQPNKSIRVQVGNFKQPISGIALASRWELPVIERGLLTEFSLGNEFNASEPDELPVGGRDIGLMVMLRGRKLPTKPRLTLGVFRSRVHKQLEERAALPLDWSDGFPEDVYTRLQSEIIDDLHIGVSLAWLGRLDTANERDSFSHNLVVSVDATVDIAGIRLWLEGFTGATPVHLGIALDAEGTFRAARAIASYRLKGVGRLKYIEPYTSLQYLDASSEFEDDAAREFGGGLVLGLAKSWRIQVGYDRQTVDSRLTGGGSRIILQAGAVF